MNTVDVSQMTEAQLHAKLQRGYDDYISLFICFKRYSFFDTMTESYRIAS